MKKIWILVPIIALVLSSCAPSIFNSKDESGNLVNITGIWISEVDLVELKTFNEATKLVNVALDDQIKKTYKLNLKLNLSSTEKEGEFTGSSEHVYINQSEPYNREVFTDLKIDGSLKNSTISYKNKNQPGATPTKVSITGEFSKGIFKGRMSIERTFNIIIVPTGESISSPNAKNEENKNYFVYSVSLSQKK